VGNSSVTVPPVNKNFYLLDLTPEQKPFVASSSGKRVHLPDDPYGRWFVRTHFKNMQATEAGCRWYEQHDPTKFEPIQGVVSTPREYQVLSINRMEFSNCGLWLDMGLGKTFVTIAYCMRLWNRNKQRPWFLVVCPPSLFGVWEDEIFKHIDSILYPKFCLAHGPRRRKNLSAVKRDTSAAPKFIITTYETLGSVLQYIADIPFASVTLDEGQRIKNLETSRTKVAHTIVKTFPYARRFILSGTPSRTNPLGFYSLYEWMGEGFTGCPNFAVYKNTFTSHKLFMRVTDIHGVNYHILAEPDDMPLKWLKKNSPPGENISYFHQGYRFERGKGPKILQIQHHYRRTFGGKNLDQLHMIAQQHSYTVKKEDVLHELPPKEYSYRYVDMTQEMKRVYQEILRDNRTELEGRRIRFSDNTSPFVKLHQVANGFLKTPDGLIEFKNNPKLEILKEDLDQIGNQKCVIWSPYRDQLNILQRNIPKCAVLHGGVPVSRRADLIREFQSPSGPSILLANPSVGGEGLNLQVSAVEIFVCNWWNPTARSQAEDRLHRIGQKRAVLVIDYVTRGTIEVKILRNLRKQKDVENEIIEASDLTGD